MIGSGAGAQRLWFSQGTIDQYVIAPEYVGYRVTVLGRTAHVRVSSLNPHQLVSVGLIEVTLDDPSNARLVLASDLEPVMDYDTTVEFHNHTDTQVHYDSAHQVLSGTQGASSLPVYVYADQPLQSWSGNNLNFDAYLSADTLDETLYAGQSDGRVALSIAAQSQQYFYIGSQVLDDAARQNPGPALAALHAARLSQMDALPTIDP